MAITLFRISQLPTRLGIELNDIPVVLNQAYLKTLESNLKIINPTGFKAANIDQIKYQVSENGTLWSNEATININDFALTNTPQSSNQNLNLSAINQSSSVVSPLNLIPINSSCDRIRIINYTTINGLLKKNGNIVNISDVIYNYELTDLLFETALGGGSPYQVILYQCGNHLGFNNTTFQLSINVVLLAELEFLNQTINNYTVTISNVTSPVIETTDVIRIKLGDIEKNANLTVIINSPMFANSALNEVRINGQQKLANETFNISQVLDINGEALISITHIFTNLNNATTSSQVQLTLNNIDNDANKVSASNSYTSTINYN